MQFAKKWDRIKGGSPNLGSDTVPAFSSAPDATKDNFFATRIVSVNGWPPHRISLVCRFVGNPGGAVAAIPVDCFFYEGLTEAWYKINSTAVTVLPTANVPGGANYQDGIPAFFDLITPIDFPHVGADIQAVQPGTANLVFIAKDPGAGAPNGTYRFAVVADLTTFP